MGLAHKYLLVDQKEYIKRITSEIKLSNIFDVLDKPNQLSVLVIGDTIIDNYVFTSLKGRAIKDPILSVGYINDEEYAGGIIAIANHLNDFVAKIKLVTLLGEKNSRIDFIQKSIKNNIQLKTFTKNNAPTTIKKRYVNAYRNNKLFKIEYMDDTPITTELTAEIIGYLDQEIPKHDFVLVGDFGHGFINDQIRRKLEEKSKFLAINVQSNSANMGYNYFNLYEKADFLSIDEQEFRLPKAERFAEIEEIINGTKNPMPYKSFLITRGKQGCIYVKNNKLIRSPIVIESVKDTVGAGDALFAISSLLTYLEVNEELIPFIGNCAGGIAANIIGNKESITKNGLLHFIEEIYKEVDEEEIHAYFNSVSNTLSNLDKGSVARFTEYLMHTYNKGGIIYVFGNGGSGATASHFVGDLIKGVSCGLDKRFKAICLNDNIPALMAIANDISYDDIFVEQLKNFLTKEDLVIGISGSGNSVNVVKAFEYSKKFGAKTLAICGFKGGKIKEIADLSIHAKIDDMEISEDIHNLIMIHCVKRILQKELKNENVGKEHAKRIDEEYTRRGV